MKKVICSLSLVCWTIVTAADLPFDIEDVQDDLRGYYAKKVDDCARLREGAGWTAALAGDSTNAAKRLVEFSNQLRILPSCDPDPLPETVSGPSLMWRPRERYSVRGVQAADQFKCGPGKCVSPSSGEFFEAVSDISFASRGGLTCELSRMYSSHSDYDCGFGTGWDCSLVSGVVFDRENPDESTTCRLFLQDEDVVFRRKGKAWIPDEGHFFSLQRQDDRVMLLLPSRTRFEFELAAEQVDGESRWRLASISSRHDQWTANRIGISYLDGCDRLKRVVGIRGETIDFAYDKSGRVVALQSGHKGFRYEYDENGCLVKVKLPPVQTSLTKIVRPEVSYSYSKSRGKWMLVRKSSSVTPFSLQVEYDDSRRVVRCGYVSPIQKQLWNLQYASASTTVAGPFPSPKLEYVFGAKEHSSLPTCLNVPSQSAVWRYAYNRDCLPIETIDPIGVRTVRVYDSDNKDFRMRGNLLCERKLAGRGEAFGWKEFGTRVTYEKDVDLPLEILTYQVATNGVEELVKRELFTYRKGDYSPETHCVTGGAESGLGKTRTFCNRFGEVALEIDANDNVTINEYAAGLPAGNSYEFSDGSVDGGGLLVRTIQDADGIQKDEALNRLGCAPLYRNESVRLSVRPVTLTSRFAWDVNGNQIRSECGHALSLSVKNGNGDVLAEYNNSSGVKVVQYSDSGRVESVFTEFVPTSNAIFQGQQFLSFSGNFFAATSQYDDLLQLKEQELSNEPIQGAFPKFVYARYSSGKIRSVTNPVGVCRVDEYDKDSGYLVRQILKGKSGELVLGRNLSWFPNGAVRVYETTSGAFATNRLDAFGRLYEVADCNGMVTRTIKDALDRTVTVKTYSGDKVYSQSRNSYDDRNGLVSTEEDWKSDDGQSGDWLLTQTNVYDGCGNVIASRGVRDGSWSVYCYDGLGRKVATRNPAGDKSVSVYDCDTEMMTAVSVRAEDEEEEFEQGQLCRIDDAGRVVDQMPVNSDGMLATNRVVRTAYNAVGKAVWQSSMDLSAVEKDYNSLGWVTEERVIPKTSANGERPLVSRMRYRPDGNIEEKCFTNEALAMFDREHDVKTELVSAPQITRTRYDEFGRVESVTNPDGLVLSYQYNSHSFPVQMQWSHLSDPTNIIRSILLSYTQIGAVDKVLDGRTQKTLQEFQYDPAGRVVRAVDSCNMEVIEQHMRYDSLGQMISELHLVGGARMPECRRILDPVAGKTSVLWEGMDFGAECWTRETHLQDVSGRIKSIVLDDETDPFVTWKYRGAMPMTREIPDWDLIQKNEYTELGELSKQSMYVGTDSVGEIEYGYGPQGQAEYSGSRLAGSGVDCRFSHYVRFDAYRRMISQNGENVLPQDGEWRSDWKRVFGLGPKRSLSSLGTGQMNYDQANNIWVKYVGQRKDDDPGSIDREQSPIFISSAKPCAFKAEPLPDLYLKELASNRERAYASYDDRDKLRVEEQEYDLLGNLVKYKGQYWNGVESFPVAWELEYDALGRLSTMKAKADECCGYVNKGEVAAELNFAYDVANRRIVKRVRDCSRYDTATTNDSYTLYSGNQQKLVLVPNGDKLRIVEEYLWNGSGRELLMAAMMRGEKTSSAWPERYCILQDRGLNVVCTLKLQNWKAVPVSASSYLGFGENATMANIESIRSSLVANDSELAYDFRKDEEREAEWISESGRQYMELKLREKKQLAGLTMWAGVNFPNDYRVYVLPERVQSPDRNGLGAWELANIKYCVAECKQGNVQGHKKRDSYFSPYRIRLGEREGDRIVIVWEQYWGRRISVREFEVQCVPDNPSAIAYAGQWLDRETGLYYQINRYRIAGSDKFISPDPLGFFDGPNMYAYAQGNPLEWHDPDGRALNLLAQVGIGAAIGAVFGGGGYALRCWWTGEEFSWSEFAIQTLVGAASGAIAGLTFGVCAPAFGCGWWAAVGAGAVTGAAGGGTAGVLDAGIHGALAGDSMGDVACAVGMGGLKGAVVGAVAGAVGGGVVGAWSAPKDLSVFGHRLPNTARGFLTAGSAGWSSGVAGSVAGDVISGLETGDYSGIGESAVMSGIAGMVSGIAVHGTLTGIERLGNVTWDTNRRAYWKNEAAKHPDLYSAENLARMRNGSAPQRINPKTGQVESMELHHKIIPRRSGLPRTLVDQPGNLKQVWPDEHRAIDPFRK